VTAYLGGEVESQIAVVLYSILDKQRNLAGQAELDRIRQPARLAEVCEILEGEGQGDGLSQVNLDIFAGLVNAAMLPKLN
jgi:hypothetical protein